MNPVEEIYFYNCTTQVPLPHNVLCQTSTPWNSFTMGWTIREWPALLSKTLPTLLSSAPTDVHETLPTISFDVLKWRKIKWNGKDLASSQCALYQVNHSYFLPFLKDNHIFTNTCASTHKKTPVIPSNQLTWCRITNIYSKILQYIPLKAEAISKIFGTEY